MKIKFCLEMRFPRFSKEPRSVGGEAKMFVAEGFAEAAKAHSEGRFKSACNMATALRSFQSFLGGKDLRLCDVGSECMKGYQNWLVASGKSLNTVSCYMRSLRALYRKTGGTCRDAFSKVFTGHVAAAKKAFLPSDIRKIVSLRLQPGTAEAVARDMFLFCLYCQGMPFVDAAFLKSSQLSNGRITYIRRKTRRPVSVELNPLAEAIVMRYRGKNNLYMFPIITSCSPAEAYSQYRSALRRYNLLLKSVAQKAGLEAALSSYVARHTWASIAYKNDVDMQVISRAMGHSRFSTTMSYISDLGNDRLRRANQLVIDECNPRSAP